MKSQSVNMEDYSEMRKYYRDQIKLLNKLRRSI